MKKAINFLFLIMSLLLTTIICQAQENFKVGITMGQVYPLNEFKSTDHTSVQSGYSQTGFTLNVDGDYFIHNRISLSLKFHFGNAPINLPEFKDRLNNELKDFFSENDSIQYDINYWQWVSPLIGCKFNYPIVLNKVYIEAGIYTGINFTQIPDQNLVFNDKKNKQLIISQNVEKNDISIPFNLIAGFRFRINKLVQLKIGAEYFKTKANYNHISYIKKDNSTENFEITKSEYNVPIQTLNANIGLVYNF